MSWKVSTSINMNLGKWVLRMWIRWNWFKRIIYNNHIWCWTFGL